jgi:hypothetical protein
VPRIFAHVFVHPVPELCGTEIKGTPQWDDMVRRTTQAAFFRIRNSTAAIRNSHQGEIPEKKM